jgi:hypothetical protein
MASAFQWTRTGGLDYLQPAVPLVTLYGLGLGLAADQALAPSLVPELVTIRRAALQAPRAVIQTCHRLHATDSMYR